MISSGLSHIGLALFALRYAPTVAADNAVWPYQSFLTEPKFNPPIFDIQKSGDDLADGYIIFTPQTESLNPIGAKQLFSSMIMTDDGELVWCDDTLIAQTNLFVQELDGKSVLTHWKGTGSNTGHGFGSTAVLDDAYNTIYEVCVQDDFVTSDGTSYPCYNDLHESFITDQGTMLVTAVNTTQADLTSVGGPSDGWIWDTMFYEVDIKTNETLMRWSPFEAGISLNTSKATFTDKNSGNGTRLIPWDWFHTNSVQRVGDKYLVNARHTWSTYLINSKGEVEWHIDGGDGGDFKLPSEDLFKWQHHARAYDLTDSSVEIHLFNNDNANWDNGSVTYGLKMSLDLNEKTATVLQKFQDMDDTIYTDSQGSFWPLDNGNTLLGYGSIAKIKEYGSDGKARMTLTFGEDNLVMSYRSYRQEWNATPSYQPKACMKDNSVYMSWNGATNVTDWVVYGGSSANNLSKLGKVAKSGFETSYNLTTTAAFVQAQAYSGDKLLDKSDVVGQASCTVA